MHLCSQDLCMRTLIIIHLSMNSLPALDPRRAGTCVPRKTLILRHPDADVKTPVRKIQFNVQQVEGNRQISPTKARTPSWGGGAAALSTARKRGRQMSSP